MKLQIFDVLHGACALLTCDNGARLMIDCGSNAMNDWKPGSYLSGLGITHLDMLAITNYDEDHVSGLPNLLENVSVGWLWRNTSITAPILNTMKLKNGIGKGIKSLMELMGHYCSNAAERQPTFLDVELKAFCNYYPKFDDTNNLSMAFHLNLAGISFLFPGDLEFNGWKTLCQNADFCSVLQRTQVLIAPHHGRENGIYPAIFSDHGCMPNYVVISDKPHMYDTQKTASYYAGRSLGGPFRSERKRNVLSTRNDGLITFICEQGRFYPF